MPKDSPEAYLLSNPYYSGAPYAPAPRWVQDPLGRKARSAAYPDPAMAKPGPNGFDFTPAFVPESEYRYDPVELSAWLQSSAASGAQPERKQEVPDWVMSVKRDQPGSSPAPVQQGGSNVPDVLRTAPTYGGPAPIPQGTAAQPYIDAARNALGQHAGRLTDWRAPADAPNIPDWLKNMPTYRGPAGLPAGDTKRRLNSFLSLPSPFSLPGLFGQPAQFTRRSSANPWDRPQPMPYSPRKLNPSPKSAGVREPGVRPAQQGGYGQ